MSQDSAHIEAQVNGALAKLLPEGTQIAGEMQLMRDLGLDSAGIMDVVMDLEDRLNISVPVDRIVEIETVGDLCRAIETFVRTSG